MKSRFLLLAFAASWNVCWPSSASAQAAAAIEPNREEVAEARQHFQLGLQLYREGDGRAALAEMRRAYQIAPSPRLLYNIGQAALEAHDYAAAFDSLTGYLNSNARDVTEARRREVIKELDFIRERVGFITVETNMAAAEVVLDGVAVPPEHVGPITVQQGRHELTLVMPDGSTLTRQVDVAARDSTVLRLYQAETPPPAASPALPNSEANAAPPPARPLVQVQRGHSDRRRGERSSALRPIAWVGVATTVGFGITTVASGLLTQRAERNHQNILRSTDDPAEEEASASRVKNSALATNVFLGVTMVSAISTVTLFYLDGRSEEANKPARSLALRTNLSQLELAGTF